MSDSYVMQPGEDAWVNIVESATGEVVDRAFGKSGARQKLAVWNSRRLPDDPRIAALERDNARLRALAWWPHDHEHRHAGMQRQHSHRHFHAYEGGEYDFNVEAHPVTHRDHDHDN